MGPHLAARVLALLGLLAIVFTGMAFLGVALYLWFDTVLSPTASAVATAAVFIFAAALSVFVAALRGGKSDSVLTADNAALSALADVAKDKPLLAVLLAGLIGAADAVKQPNR